MKALKWLGILVGSVIGLVLLAAIVVPLVVDVDKYRPQIVEAANKQINGKLEIGKLSLSLWGQIRVQVDGLDLKDKAGRSVVSVKDAFFHLPFLSILSGSPEMIFKMDRPRVEVIKYKNGKMNAMGLVKSSEPAEGAAGGGAQANAAAKPAAPAAPMELPSIATHARLGIEMKGAQVGYTDEATGLKSEVKDLNLVIKDISLSRTTELQMWADLDTTMGKAFALKGPARVTAHLKPALVGGTVDGGDVDAHVDLDGLDISAGGAFHKSPGMAAHADLAAKASGKQTQLEKLDVKFFNAEVKASGKIVKAPNAEGASEVNLIVASNEIDLKSWNQLVPMLKDYDLAGTAKLDATAQGPSEKLGYKAKFAIKGLTAKAPKLKAEPRFDVLVDVITDEIQNLQMTMKAPGNELEIKGKLVNFAKPQGTFAITSPGMDLDQLVDWPPPAAKTAAAEPAKDTKEGTAGAGGAGAPASDLDASLDSLRKSPAAADAAVVATIGIKMLKAQGIRMDDMAGKLYFKALTAGLEGFSMKMWNGTLKSSFAAQLKPEHPTYTMGMLIDGMDLQKAVEANVQAVKNTLLGRLHFELNGSGASFNTEPAKSNLKAKGAFKVDNATFATIDVTKMASEGINKAIEKIGDKVPQAKGKQVGTPGNRKSEYEWISANFTIDGGKFKMPDFATKAKPKQGIDLKGNTEVGIKDYALNTTWDVIDTFNLTGANFPVDVAGTHIEHLLAEGNNPVKFTVHAGCTCFQPCYSYTEVPEQLLKVALNNVTGAATARAKSEVANKIQQVVPKSAPPAVQNAVQNLGKKLFH